MPDPPAPRSGGLAGRLAQTMTRPILFLPVLVGPALVLGLTASSPQPKPAQAAPGPFVDATALAGLDHAYRTGATGGMHIPEIMGAGAALVDIDNDGDLDVYLVQGGALGPEGLPQPSLGRDRLYRTDLETVYGDGPRVRLVDVSEAYGLTPGGYGMGVAAGDVDNDGWTDLLVTGYGRTRLLRNTGGRRLVDVTDRSGLSDTGWSMSAAFLDYDHDGWLDLFLVRYVTYTPVPCVLPSGRRDYCGPKSFAPQADRLFRNVRGRFEDVSATALTGGRPAPGLGVVAADVNGDGFVDLYVANDGADNQLWMNQQGRGFKEDGLLAGVALNASGLAEAGMGVDAGDVDHDGDLDLFVTNLTGETNTLYVNDGRFFEDRTIAAGLAAPSLPLTGFGTRFVDYDNDGHLDLPIVNGAVHVTDATPAPATPRHLGQPRLLFRNLGAGRFSDVTSSAGAAFAAVETSRGLAVGDIDDDGDADLLVANADMPSRLLLNTSGQDAPWLGVRLLTADGRRDAHGATATFRRESASALVRHVHPDGSYASSSDPRLLVGLGNGQQLTSVDVRWPDGSEERFPPPPLRRYTTLRQGTGTSLGPTTRGPR